MLHVLQEHLRGGGGEGNAVSSGPTLGWHGQRALVLQPSPSSAPCCRTGTVAGAGYLQELLLKLKRLWIPLRDQAGEAAQGSCPAGGLWVIGR